MKLLLHCIRKTRTDTHQWKYIQTQTYMSFFMDFSIIIIYLVDYISITESKRPLLQQMFCIMAFVVGVGLLDVPIAITFMAIMRGKNSYQKIELMYKKRKFQNII